MNKNKWLTQEDKRKGIKIKYSKRTDSMEEAQNKQSKLQEFLEGVKNKIFGTMLELLKEKKAGNFDTSHNR